MNLQNIIAGSMLILSALTFTEVVRIKYALFLAIFLVVVYFAIVFF